MKKVVFFTEFSTNIGYGHISRCSALAEEFYRRNFDIEFVIRGGNSTPKMKFYHTLYDWDKSLLLENYISNNTFFIFDTYRVSKSKLNMLAEKIEYPISISDSQQVFIEKGLVIFSSAYGNEIIKNLDGINFKYLAGPKYMFFRKEFLDQLGYKRITKEKVRRIVISLGSFSNINDLLSIIKLTKEEFNEVEIIVFGKVLHKEKIQKIPGITFLDFVDINEYIEVLITADFAILNGGQSLNEALLLKVPSIAIPVVENQKENIQYWSDRELCFPCDNFLSLNFKNTFKSALKKIKDHKAREKLTNLENNLDGLGVKRIVDFLHQNTI